MLAVIVGLSAAEASAASVDAADPPGIHNHQLITTSLFEVEAAIEAPKPPEPPAWTSILPPLVAIALALALRQVLVALVPAVDSELFQIHDAFLRLGWVEGTKKAPRSGAPTGRFCYSVARVCTGVSFTRTAS